MQRHLLLGLVLCILPLSTACQSFGRNVRRSLSDIDSHQLARAQVAFDPDAMQIELRCRDGSDECREMAEEVRAQVISALKEIEAKQGLKVTIPARMRVQIQVTGYWNPMNLLIAPMLYGIPVDRQTADVRVDIEYDGQMYGGKGGGGCFSSLFILRGPDGSSGCAIGEGIAEALNEALGRAQSLRTQAVVE